MAADVRVLPLMFKFIEFAIICVLLATPLAVAQEIQNDPNLPADQLVPEDSPLTPGSDEIGMVGDVESQKVIPFRIAT